MTEYLHIIFADLRYAGRQLRRAPSLTIAAILCFALGIGANTSIFSVVDAVLFRSLPFPNADQLVLVGEGLPKFGGDNFGVISAPEFADYRQLDGRIFHGLAIYEGASFALSGGNAEPERVTALRTSASLLGVLGVGAARGRPFVAADDSVGAPAVAMISDALWQRRFASDPQTIGRSIDVDGMPRTVVGILPPSARFPMPGVGGDAADIFVPYPMTPAVERKRGNNYETFLIGRLAPGVTLAQTKRAVGEVAASMATRHPDLVRADWLTVADVFPFRRTAVKDVQKPLLILLGAVGIVLLIACINVSSLLLARAAARRREIVVRQALGASRARLVQQFFAESLLLVSAGGGVGVLFAVWGARALAAHAPQALAQGSGAAVDLRVLGVTALVVILTAFIFSIIPAAAQSANALGSALREETRSAGGARGQRSRQTLVVMQVALALILAAGAGLMARSFARAISVDSGFDPSHALAFRVGLPKARFAKRADFLRVADDIADRMRSLPGATAASATTSLPMTSPSRVAFAVEGVTIPKIPVARGEIVLADYFGALRIPLRDGRDISAGDIDGTLKVVVVNQTLAKQYLGDKPAVGRRIKWGSPASPNPWLTIVGVAADVKTSGLDQPVEPAIYFPLMQQDSVSIDNLARTLAYVVRVKGDPRSLINEVRQTMRAVDPTLPIIALQPLSDIVDVSIADRRFNTALLGIFAALALTLASIGIYGLVAYTVVQRTREIGIRLAMGATSADMLAMVVGRGMRLAFLGTVIGLGGALALGRTLRTLLFDVSPFDPLAFGGAAILLLAIAAGASYFPARRAAMIDPQSAIRAD